MAKRIQCYGCKVLFKYTAFIQERMEEEAKANEGKRVAFICGKCNESFKKKDVAHLN